MNKQRKCVMDGFLEKNRDSCEDLVVFSHSVEWFNHFHSPVEIFYSHTDLNSVEIDGEIFPVKQGWFCFINSFSSHANFGEGLHTCLMIPQKYLGDFNAFTKQKVFESPLFFDENGEILSLISQIGKGENQNDLIKKGLVNHLLGKILEKGKLVKPNKQILPEHLKAFILFVHENYNKQISLSLVAKNIGVSRSLLSKTINETFNKSFCDYLNDFRFKKFMEKLSCLRDKEKILTLALDCGFGSEQSFYRNFKSRYGVSPQAYYKNKYLKQ